LLDREVVKDFLVEELKDAEIEIPKRINKKRLVEAFCRFTEDDYYEWLKDNFKSFFNHWNPDWDWIEEKIAELNEHT